MKGQGIVSSSSPSNHLKHERCASCSIFSKKEENMLPQQRCYNNEAIINQASTLQIVGRGLQSSNWYWAKDLNEKISFEGELNHI